MQIPKPHPRQAESTPQEGLSNLYFPEFPGCLIGQVPSSGNDHICDTNKKGN